ncbi:hypothetical protein M011DRAFT_473218 [Sporormia fimetaria CBS 119925]|uniref:Pyruvate dehydrogenase protein x component n=1 Tax=Sporormia fimetaria CBS 119925 TaxID=1340428 RepID=A0A6A6VPX2_9PLEO|nr:hypothetical protein M011DRAFT_473218 [Sporormia fimetaria CBS 119925]
MASLTVACRLSARATAQRVRSHGARRAFRTAAALQAAQNFNMPALSPTMTEGNIATWKLKEGDSYSAGDVLLEIETDKAQMDVEAQDDGILAKIIQGDGSKSVQVGTRIAVTAEPGDDISSLEILPEDSAAPKQQETKKAEPKHETPKEPEPVPKEERAAPQPSQAASKPSAQASKAQAQKQKYPLYPAVQHLLLQNGLSKDEADKIPATGRNGRLLKGDVLAYLGRVEQAYVEQQSARIGKLAHLDLSNIKLAAPKPAPPKETAAAEAPRTIEKPEVEIALPVSLGAVLKYQKGLNMPVSTLVARAAARANRNLPVSKTAKPSADELFNAVLGLNKGHKKGISRGHFVPRMSAAPSPSRRSGASKPDILDILSGKKATPRKPSLAAVVTAKTGVETRVFSVSVPKGDERRGQVFLEQFRHLLEKAPEQLVTSV